MDRLSGLQKEIDALLKAMLGLESSSLQLISKDKTLQVTLELKLAQPK